MTRDDIRHLSEVLEGVTAQGNAQPEMKMPDAAFETLVGHMLWAIHASKNNPHFDENTFRAIARGDTSKALFEEGKF